MTDQDNTLDDKMKTRIDGMSHEQMARAWRYAPGRDLRFQGAAGEYFTKRFKELGGMSPEISKVIGEISKPIDWDN